MTVICCAKTDRGRVRSHNEDAFFTDPELGLFIVSDGIGGGPAGEKISRVVVEGLPLLVRRALDVPKDGFDGAGLLDAAIRHLNTRMCDMARTCDLPPGSGATVVACLMRDNRAWVAHMGDSRAYLFRDGILERKTTDHSLVQMMLDAGAITEKEAAHHPLRHVIVKNVGMPESERPDTVGFRVRPGYRILLCSDGLTGMLSDTQIRHVLRREAAIETACDRLVNDANHAGGTDNITVVLVQVGTQHEAPDPMRVTPKT